MDRFLSCDWGTTSFRLRLVAVPSLVFDSVESSRHGIAQLFELWKQGGSSAGERVSFYQSVIDMHVRLLEKRSGMCLQNIPLVISGMASSSIGMIELPYKDLPFDAGGSDLVIRRMPESKIVGRDLMIISGARTEDGDVMRGEETQLAGCTIDVSAEQVYIFPGTHSKHITVKSGQVVNFKTYMTGEFFDLLSTKSVLSGSIEPGEGLAMPGAREIFEKGIKDSLSSNLLNSSFRVRTNDLFGKLTKQQNYYYLSGLLIGSELAELATESPRQIGLVVNDELEPYYVMALNVLGTGRSQLTVTNAGKALVKGQFRIYTMVKD
jgi:2-dehydro-3-deoxygalactonokinase